MRLFRSLRDERALLRKSAEFVAVLMPEPAPADVEWLAERATRGDVDHARWELRYSRRAVGSSSRSATRSTTARRPRSLARASAAHAEGPERRRRIGPRLAERQFNARLSAYRDAFTLARPRYAGASGWRRLSSRSPAGRFRGDDPVIQRGGEIVAATYLAEANEALRDSFGAAELAGGRAAVASVKRR